MACCDLEASSEAEVFARWQRAAAEDPAAGRAWRSPEDLGWYFQRFRPRGEGLDAALVGLLEARTGSREAAFRPGL